MIALQLINKLVLTLMPMPSGDFVRIEMNFVLIHTQLQKAIIAKLHLFHIGIWNVGTALWKKA